MSTAREFALKAGFHMIATNAVIAEIVTIDGFHMIATIAMIAEIVTIDGFHMIATIAEKVKEDRGDLRLTTSFAPFVKFNMAAVNLRFADQSLWVFFNWRKRRRERQRTHGFFAVGNAVHPSIFAVTTIAVVAITIAGEWFPYDHCNRHDRWDRIEVYLSDRCRCNRHDCWRVVSIWSLRSRNFFFQWSQIAAIVAII